MKSTDHQRGLLKLLKLSKMSINLGETFIFDSYLITLIFGASYEYNITINLFEDAILMK